MAVDVKERYVRTFHYTCDRCGREESANLESDDFTTEDSAAEALSKLPPPVPAGWRLMKDGLTGQDVAFHTQRCAVGQYRDQVGSAWDKPLKPLSEERAKTKGSPGQLEIG